MNELAADRSLAREAGRHRLPGLGYFAAGAALAPHTGGHALQVRERGPPRLQSDHYLHVYANYYAESGEPDRAIGSCRQGLKPMAAFLHANVTDEQRLRTEFARIHVCRRFALLL
ncbi:hypothetical protein [Streptomyces inhibens]|uniref:hypothetical protein n=1 Tax=Streptomyces inhibens TaxID=2293571 RepID=UPI000FFBB366|nr:hypothetical protein [Streptomyces inhibens]